MLFNQIPNDPRFRHWNSSLIARKIIHQSMKPELNEKIKKIIIDIYKERGQESDFYKKYTDYLISHLDN